MAPSNSNPIDYFAIQNVIAQYCIALDTKDFGRLRHVFTEDVAAKYPAFGSIEGVDFIAESIQNRLEPVTSQHALTTQTIEIAEDGKTATATTYFTGIHFGQGKWVGHQVTAWGKYADRLVRAEGKETLPGASGRWLICEREVTFMGRLGEEGVMRGEDG